MNSIVCYTFDGKAGELSCQDETEIGLALLIVDIFREQGQRIGKIVTFEGVEPLFTQVGVT